MTQMGRIPRKTLRRVPPDTDAMPAINALTVSSFDIAAIENAIYKFQLKEGLNQGDPVVYAQIIGGFDSAHEAPEAGAMRAVVLSTKLQTGKSGMFRNMSSNIDSSSKISSGQVDLVFTFGPKS